MSMSVQIKAFTHYGVSILEDSSKANQQSFRDVVDAIRRRNYFVLTSELFADHDVTKYEHINTIVDSRQSDVVYVYSLVETNPTQAELQTEHKFAEYIRQNYIVKV